MSRSSRRGEERLDLCLAAPRFHSAYSGPGIRFKRYAPWMRERGVRMRVFTTAREGFESSETEQVPDNAASSVAEVVDGIPIRRMPVRGSWNKNRFHWRFEQSLFHYCRSGSPPDVLQLLSLRGVSSSYWLPRLRSLGIPIVYTHTMMRDPSVGWLRNQIWLRPFRRVDCTVVSTREMRDSLIRSGCDGPIEVIPNGVDTRLYRPPSSGEERGRLRNRLGIPVSAEVILFVGGYLIHRKGVDLLAAAWQSVARERPRAHLLLVGPTIDSLRAGDSPGAVDSNRSFLDGVRKRLDASGAMDRVLFTGAVDNVEEYLRAADVFVFPSRREGMPNVVHEAYATALPSVICPFIGMSREFGEDGIHYLHASHEASDIATRTLELLTDDSRREVIGRAARAWVVESFRVEASVDAYCRLYRKLAARQ